MAVRRFYPGQLPNRQLPTFMPELPEVEHIATWLRPQLVGRTVTAVRALPGGERCLPQGAAAVNALVAGKRVTGVGRRAKLITLELAGGSRLAIHLKMTGQLWRDARDPAHARVELAFARGPALRLVDVRKFGWVQAWNEAEFRDWEAAQGPEPVPALPEGWAATLRGRRAVKAALIDPAVVAGIGNIYADEILFRARLAPTRPLDSLSPAERRRLAAAVEKEMQAAVAERSGEPDQLRVGGGDRSVKALFDWKVFQREGEPCRTCGTPITRSVVAQRGTYSCSLCQR